MNHPEIRMSDAMRRLNAMAPPGAPPALGDMLKDEFRRHHARRGRNAAVRFSLLAACLMAGVGSSILLLRPHVPKTVARNEIPQTAPTHEPILAGLVKPTASEPIVRKVRAPSRTQKNPPAEAARFVSLPTFDPAIPIDHLELVRLDLPGRALQLVGFPVSEEFADRRVVADVLLAQDGTPYALRLVRSSENKEPWQ